jgi:hypothetical protein
MARPGKIQAEMFVGVSAVFIGVCELPPILIDKS